MLKPFGLLLALLGLWVWSRASLAAPMVRPADRVITSISIYPTPTSASQSVGKLLAEEAAPLVGTSGAWHEIRLPGGGTGFVSRAWTAVFDDLANSTAPYRVHMVDVGTGLAIFVEGPDFSLLYDGGSNDDLATGPNNRLVAYLRNLRPSMTTIDHVVLSHPHRDHVQLLPDVFEAYQVKNVWDSGIPNLICPYRAFLRLIRDKQVAYHDAHNTTGPHVVTFNSKPECGVDGVPQDVAIPHAAHLRKLERHTIGSSAHMTFLTEDAAQHSSFNQNSLVLLLELGSSRILLMGDAEAGGRKDPSKPPTPKSIEGILLKCCSAELKSDVLVVGHHGSKTSSRNAFVSKSGARVFLVSSGPTKYDEVTLPDPEVTTQLDRIGTVYPTYKNDDACKLATAKIGPDHDQKAGGCDNLVLTISESGEISRAWRRTAD